MLLVSFHTSSVVDKYYTYTRHFIQRCNETTIYLVRFYTRTAIVSVHWLPFISWIIVRECSNIKFLARATECTSLCLILLVNPCVSVFWQHRAESYGVARLHLLCTLPKLLTTWSCFTLRQILIQQSLVEVLAQLIRV